LREDRREGYGIFTWASGKRFEGVWKNGKQEGNGVYYYLNGEKY